MPGATLTPMLQVPKLLFGAGAVRALPDELRGLGATTPLLVSDRGLAACGVFERVRATIPAEQTPLLFTDVSENPTYDGVDRVAHFARASRCDVVVAVGGGSVIDTAKLVAVLVRHAGTASDYVGHSERVTAKTAPLIVIPTTAGTGSEASPDAGIHPSADTRSGGITSTYLVPRVAICDPELTLSLPSGLTAATALDALSHCIEGFLAVTASPLADAMALDGVTRMWRHVERATFNGRDLESRAQLMLAAFAGGVAIAKGLGPAHAIAITLGDQGLHHGMLSGLGIVATIELMRRHVPEKVAQLARAMDLAPDASVAAALRERIHGLGLPGSLRALGYQIQDMDELAQAAAASHFNFTSAYRPNAGEYACMIRSILD